MVSTNPRVVSYFGKIQFKPQYSPFWRTTVPFMFIRIAFYKLMIVKGLERHRKSNSEIFIQIYVLSNFPAKKHLYFTS